MRPIRASELVRLAECHEETMIYDCVIYSFSNGEMDEYGEMQPQYSQGELVKCGVKFDRQSDDYQPDVLVASEEVTIRLPLGTAIVEHDRIHLIQAGGEELPIEVAYEVVGIPTTGMTVITVKGKRVET